MKPFLPVVIGDLRKHRLRSRSGAAGAVIDELERRLFLSTTLGTIAAFNGSNGANPIAVVADSSGNLFGITDFTYANGNTNANPGPGVLFEIPINTGTIKDLYTFSDPAGVDAIPSASSLIIDSSGNLYGTLNSGIVSTPNTVFEVRVGTTTPITIATFAEGDQNGRITAVDSAGNVYGYDGDNVIQVLNNSGMITTLGDAADQLQQNIVDLQLGPDGNLYGVTAGPNADLFEITPSNGNLQIPANFDPTTTGDMPIGLTFDANGNIWGFCQEGGPNGNGTVWEMTLPATSPDPGLSFIASFTQASGLTVVSRPAFDSAGNLYGLTENGGANGNGTVFDLPAGGTTLTDLYDWLGGDPDLPEGIVTTSSGIAAVDPSTTTSAINTEGIQITPSGTVVPQAQQIEMWNSIFNKLSTASLGGFGFVNFLPQYHQIIQNNLEKFYNQLVQAGEDEDTAAKDTVAAYNAASNASPFEVHQVELAAVQSGISAQIAPIKTMLSTATHDLGAVKPQVSKDTSLLAQETKETSLITALNAQLAAQTNSAKQAAIQKKITADTAVQTSVTNQESTVYNTALTALDNIQTLQASITAALAALPAPFASLSGVISTVPPLITPGKKASAVVTVTNTGNAGTPALSFQTAISARPEGTDGSADISLGAVLMKVHLKAQASAPVHLNIAIPKGFPAGTYSLVLEPFPDSAFTSAPTPIVSTMTFTVP